MIKLFVDTNVLIDLLADRKPFSKFAIELFSKAEKSEVQLFISSHSIVTTHYLLKKYVDEQQLRKIISGLLEYVTVIAVDNLIIEKALRSEHKDFEDAVQMECASSVNSINNIVTRNLKDFKKSSIPAVSPDQLFEIRHSDGNN